MAPTNTMADHYTATPQVRVMTLALAERLIAETRGKDGRFDPSAAALLGVAFGTRIAGLDASFTAELVEYIDAVLKTTNGKGSADIDPEGFLKGKDMSEDETALAGLLLALG
jgi:hypothetical protein